MGGIPTLPFPLSLPSPFPLPLSFQTNQLEGRSDPVRKFHGSPAPTNTTLLPPKFNIKIIITVFMDKGGGLV